jgi:hypothetical protein
MDPLFAFAIKEEILRNILKTHNIVLVIGRPGTGKTVTSLKVGAELGPVCYFNGGGRLSPPSDLPEGVTVIDDMNGFTGATQADMLLIVDAAHRLSGKDREVLNGLTGPDGGRVCKMILITPSVMDAIDFLAFLDVVVRFRQDTAEMLVSRLRDIHNV